ncbi:uncharacterized protein LOC122298922 [Carya illinoinensis]|uniref:uncharacterized protein LOC122298922 n=1 Tax=Carya illinoinensis TaxID=32201 RepID=UPI001C71C45C|nr:uncharacterized protein LOC122298922 [Carya illinoinensis]
MGIFKLPKQLVQELNKLVRNFWWGQQNQDSKIHWVGWNQMKKGSFGDAPHQASSLSSQPTISYELEDQARGQSSNLRTHQAPWTRLWNLNLPNATKTFLWRACLNALPTRDNLKKRKVTEDSACPICLHPTETIEHTLWDCPSARDVWALSNRKFQKASTPSPSFAEKLESLEVTKETKELLLFAITTWNLWKRRNEAVFQGHLTHPSSVVNQSQQLVGVGVILRDWKSKVLATFRMKQDLFPDPHMAEAFAALQAVNFCKSLGYQDIILEGDSLLVVEGLKSKSDDLNYTGLITADTKDILNTFNSWSTRHIVRSINVVAHALSKDAFSISGRTTTFVNISSCIQTMVS